MPCRYGSQVGHGDVSERIHVIDLSLISRRVPVSLNRHYGVLLAAGETL